jgi:prepilin-type N-terminal cleavage/methylation domain-containing protein
MKLKKQIVQEQIHTGLPLRNKRLQHSAGFTLIELLTVMTIVAILGAASMPALRALASAGNTNKAATGLSQTLELARVYAMANSTYVRVVISEMPAGSGNTTPTLVALTLYSAEGSGSGDMAKPEEWPSLGKPLVLHNLKMFDSLNANKPDTSLDVTPAGTNVKGTRLADFTRRIAGLGSGNLTFASTIQFSPSGEATVSEDEPARYIKIAIDQPVGQNGSTALEKNPVIVRLSGTNGSISVLRAEDMNL